MMMRHGFVLTAILGLASVVTLPPVAAQTGASGVTGAAEGIFSRGATFNGVQMSRLTAAQGIVIAADGSATGQFQAVLMGTSLLGIPQQVIVEGEVQNGSFGADGTATISGAATVNMGDGTPPLLGVPFTVKTSTLNLGLTLGTNALPTAALTAGSVTIE
jgi:hypothetical protein